jgi:hypothetical protein
MSAPDWAQVKELLHQAVALGPEARTKFLDEVCASDAALRAELESLLSVGDELSAEFMESPPPAAILGAPSSASAQDPARGWNSSSSPARGCSTRIRKPSFIGTSNRPIS